MDLRRAGAGQPPSVETDAAVQIVRDRNHHQREDQEIEDPVDGGLPQREAEDVEAQVEVEDRVGLPELLVVHEQEHVVPPGGNGNTENQRQAGGDDRPNLTNPRFDPISETLDELLFL